MLRGSDIAAHRGRWQMDEYAQECVGTYLLLMIAEHERALASLAPYSSPEAGQYAAGSRRYHEDARSALRRALTGVAWYRDQARWTEAVSLYRSGALTSGADSPPPTNVATGGTTDGTR